MTGTTQAARWRTVRPARLAGTLAILSRGAWNLHYEGAAAPGSAICARGAPPKKMLRTVYRHNTGAQQAHMNHHKRSFHCNPRAGSTPGHPHGPIEAAIAPPARHQVFM